LVVSDYLENNLDCGVRVWVWVMVLNATFNNISVISWRTEL
jgi:hypothetical protein